MEVPHYVEQPLVDKELRVVIVRKVGLVGQEKNGVPFQGGFAVVVVTGADSGVALMTRELHYCSHHYLNQRKPKNESVLKRSETSFSHNGLNSLYPNIKWFYQK